MRFSWSWLAAALAFAGAIFLIVIQLEGEKASPDSTTLGLFALAAVLGFALFAPGQTVKALRRVTRFKVGGVELGLAEIKRADRLRPPQEDDGVRSERPRGKGYEDCVKRLENRLDRVRQMLGLEARKDDHARIAEELRLKGLLNRDEETFVLDLLKNYDPVSEDWSSATEEEFLDATWAFATRLRSLVWDRHVRQQLKDEDWFIAEYEQESGHRPDFLAYREGRWALIAVRVGSVKEAKPDKLNVVAKRLARFDEGPQIAARSIVMPNTAMGELTDSLPADAREKVKLLNLEEISGVDWKRAVGELNELVDLSSPA